MISTMATTLGVHAVEAGISHGGRPGRRSTLRGRIRTTCPPRLSATSSPLGSRRSRPVRHQAGRRRGREHHLTGANRDGPDPRGAVVAEHVGAEEVRDRRTPVDLATRDRTAAGDSVSMGVHEDRVDVVLGPVARKGRRPSRSRHPRLSPRPQPLVPSRSVISSQRFWPTSATHRSFVIGSKAMRHGLRRPIAKISGTPSPFAYGLSAGIA